jgi:Rieske Fe-S protein
MERRQFLATVWKVGAGLLAAAAVWTGWEVIRPGGTDRGEGVVPTIEADALIADDVAAVPAAASYLTRLDGEIVALSDVCTHLRCKVSFCTSSGRFECPCHGTIFNRAGDQLSGPARRGLDRHPVSIEDGVVLVDTSVTITGPPLGTRTIDEPAKGPGCDDGDGT